MRPLIDCDILRYEVGFGSEWVDDDGEKQINDFDKVKELLQSKIDIICEEVWADEEPILYLTNDKRLHDSVTRNLIKQGLEPPPYAPNFREALAVTKPYKGNRTASKPFHYDNLTWYILHNYKHKVAVGYEADDLISIDHLKEPDTTIICSRDKDLRITPGKHYGWQCGKQLGFGPKDITKLGFLERVGDKIIGGGLMFFYTQLLTGDPVDNIPGVPKWGPITAFNLLKSCESEEQMFTLVCGVYKDVFGDDWKTYFKEQAALLWMIQELDEKGSPIFYIPVDERS